MSMNLVAKILFDLKGVNFWFLSLEELQQINSLNYNKLVLNRYRNLIRRFGHNSCSRRRNALGYGYKIHRGSAIRYRPNIPKFLHI